MVFNTKSKFALFTSGWCVSIALVLSGLAIAMLTGCSTPWRTARNQEPTVSELLASSAPWDAEANLPADNDRRRTSRLDTERTVGRENLYGLKTSRDRSSTKEPRASDSSEFNEADFQEAYAAAPPHLRPLLKRQWQATKAAADRFDDDPSLASNTRRLPNARDSARHQRGDAQSDESNDTDAYTGDESDRRHVRGPRENAHASAQANRQAVEFSMRDDDPSDLEFDRDDVRDDHDAGRRREDAEFASDRRDGAARGDRRYRSGDTLSSSSTATAGGDERSRRPEELQPPPVKKPAQQVAHSKPIDTGVREVALAPSPNTTATPAAAGGAPIASAAPAGTTPAGTTPAGTTPAGTTPVAAVTASTASVNASQGTPPVLIATSAAALPVAGIPNASLPNASLPNASLPNAGVLSAGAVEGSAVAGAPAVAGGAPVAVVSASASQSLAPGATPAVPGSAQTWHDHLREALRQLEKENGAASLHPTERLHGQAIERMLHLALGELEPALKPIEGLQTAEQEFFRHEFQALHDAVDAKGNPVLARRWTLVMDSQRKAIHHLGEVSNLEVKNAAFCSNVDGYGSVTKFPTSSFRPKQEVLLYCELENFVSVPVKEGFQTVLQGSYQIVDANGHRVFEALLSEDSDICRHQRRDYFIAYRIYMPENLEPGRYQLRLTIEDMKGRKFGQSALDLQIAK